MQTTGIHYGEKDVYYKDMVLRHSTNASGSVLQILGYLIGDIPIHGCGCAQISGSLASTLQISVYCS